MACSARHCHPTLTTLSKRFLLQKYNIHGEPILPISQLNTIYPRHLIAVFLKYVKEIDSYFYFVNFFYDPQVNIVSQLLALMAIKFTVNH